jgi:DNA mismatch endonuclease (patch repair protein)
LESHPNGSPRADLSIPWSPSIWRGSNTSIWPVRQPPTANACRKCGPKARDRKSSLVGYLAMADSLNEKDRSARMSLVRARGNKSTELLVENMLIANRLNGWVKHPAEIPGTPDFYFPSSRLAVFVDGCFWHMCPRCGRLPKTRKRFWRDKIDENRRRDNRVRRRLRKLGYATLRIWEHELRSHGTWLFRLRRRLDGSRDTG